jgi:hypothetical protein
MSTEPPAPSADAARARFATATASHLTAPLADGVSLHHVTPAEVRAHAEQLWADDPRPPARLEVLYAAEERARIADLGAVFGEPLAHAILFERAGEVVGTYWGQQEPYGRYYMVNSIFRADVRRRGLYRAMLPRVVEAARAAGFAEVYSRHRADNNAVLVPKLQGGFSIAAFEVAPRFGLLVHLRRYLIDDIDRVFRHRIDGAYAAALRAAGALPEV